MIEDWRWFKKVFYAGDARDYPRTVGLKRIFKKLFGKIYPIFKLNSNIGRLGVRTIHTLLRDAKNAISCKQQS